MGQPDRRNGLSYYTEFIGVNKLTERTEISKYLEEEKITMIS